MLNKRNKKNQLYHLQPNKINSYNKFLTTLDNYFSNLKNAEKTWQPINSNFDIKTPFNIKSPFTIEPLKLDLLLLDVEINDPNIYNEFLPSNNNTSFKRIPTPPLKIKKHKIVNIDCEINTIADILTLIDTYPIQSDITYNINMKQLHNIKEPLKELNDMIGMKELKTNIVDQILYFSQNLHKNNLSKMAGDFMHTVIYGPPGTGKTEIAKIMGKIYSNLGVLDKNKFTKVTRADLIAGYLGQTALKTRDVIKDSLGGVLFIDEAYALGNADKDRKDSFSKECIDTLCEALSDHKDNLMVIIAGYEDELKDCFFSMNQGLDSRFVWRFKIDKYTYEELYSIFLKKVNEIGWSICEYNNNNNNNNNNNKIIDANWFKNKMDYFKFFGRDIETLLSKTKIAHSRRVFCKPLEEKKKITLEDLENGLKTYLNNSDIQKRQEKEYLKRQLYSSIYC
jgi:SpoVK/Ycf46/Vps4 family AAA+-type ATPase